MQMGYSALYAYNPNASDQVSEIKKFASDFTIQNTNYVNLNFSHVNYFFT
jgi:hypothetical protein